MRCWYVDTGRVGRAQQDNFYAIYLRATSFSETGLLGALTVTIVAVLELLELLVAQGFVGSPGTPTTTGVGESGFRVHWSRHLTWLHHPN